MKELEIKISNYECPWGISDKFTQEMWDGNIPAGEGYNLTNGRTSQHWAFWCGSAYTDGDKLLEADITLPSGVQVYIFHDYLWISQTLMSGQKGWSSGQVELWGVFKPELRLKFSKPQLESILRFVFPDSKICDAIMKRANEIWSKGRRTKQ